MGTPLFTGNVFEWAHFCNEFIKNEMQFVDSRPSMISTVQLRDKQLKDTQKTHTVLR